MVLTGLIILVVALLVGLVGVLTNSGSAHALTQDFTVFGYHVTGSTGTLFLSGIVVGAAAMLGLSLLLAGARRTYRRAESARRRLRQSRNETAAVRQERDVLLEQHRADGLDRPDPPARALEEGRGRGLLHHLGHRSGVTGQPRHTQHGD